MSQEEKVEEVIRQLKEKRLSNYRSEKDVASYYFSKRIFLLQRDIFRRKEN